MSLYSFVPLRLEQHVRHKEAVEKKLFSRFVPVMNEKKAKIRGLQDDLHQLQQTDEKPRNKAERQRSAWDGFLQMDFLVFLNLGFMLKVLEELETLQ